MSDTSDWNPVQVEKKLLEIVNRLAKGVLICDTAYKAFLRADHDYDLAYARAWMGADGAIAGKRYAAEIATEHERNARDAADAAYRLVRDQREALNAELEAYRSVGASVRQAYAVAGVGER